MIKMFSILILLCAQCLLAGELTLLNSELTIYNNSNALVKERFMADFSTGNNLFKFPTPKFLDTNSLRIDYTGEIINRNIFFKNYSLVGLLKDRIGKGITIKDYDRKVHGVLKSVKSNKIILEDDGDIYKYLLYNPNLKIINDSNVQVKFVEPKFELTLKPNSSGENTVDLSYFTNNISYLVEYVGILNKDNTKMHFKSWLDVRNNSGLNFKDAKISLIEIKNERRRSGDCAFEQYGYSRVFQGYEAHPIYYPCTNSDSNYFDLPIRISVNNAELKKIPIIDEKEIEVSVRNYIVTGFRYYSNENLEINSVVEFKNTCANGLGKVLPFGPFRVLKETDTGTFFVGEDLLEINEPNGKARLFITKSQNLHAESKTPVEKVLADSTSEFDYEIKLVNKNEHESAPFTIIQYLLDNYICHSFEVLEANTEYEKLERNALALTTELAPKSEKIVKFKLKIKKSPQPPFSLMDYRDDD